ncbi:MAG TPA: hypothetical protein DHW52_00195 [Alcanivorax sp.]|nr:hypothetical protein [Alcanivorax sp.]HCK25590.1 hypothetical protein [Alcanivorax sp.]
MKQYEQKYIYLMASIGMLGQCLEQIDIINAIVPGFILKKLPELINNEQNSFATSFFIVFLQLLHQSNNFCGTY